MGVLFGSLVSSYLWGWSSDRYGSKPAMMFSVFWRVLLPVIYMLTPRNVALSLPYAMFASMIQGVVDVGWTIGSARLLYVGVVPTAKKSEYMALHYAWIGVIGGTSQLLGGRLLDASSNLTGQIGAISLDAYTPLFVLSVILAAVSIVFFARVRADAEYGVGEFAGMFTRQSAAGRQFAGPLPVCQGRNGRRAGDRTPGKWPRVRWPWMNSWRR
ncbi:MAG: hypothetical protein R2851_24880 [Caldilineaceae bacterium]